MSTFQALRLVTLREIKERGRSRAYMFSSAFTIILLLSVIVIPSVISSRGLTHHVGLLGDGNQGVIDAARQFIETDDGDVTIETTELGSRSEAEGMLEAGDVDVVLVDGSVLLTKGSGGFTGSPVESLLQRAAGSARIQGLVAESGTAAADVIALLTTDALDVQTLSADALDDEQRTRRGLVAYGGLMLMYVAVLTYGAWTLSGVTEEKTNRVVEVLLSTLKPWQLLAGKVIGIGVLGLAQFLITIGLALVAIRLTGAFELPEIPVDSLLTLVVWFILGFAVYSVTFAASGSLVSRMEDAQNAAAPITILAVVGFMVSFFVLDDPESVLGVVTSLIPFTAPFVVPIRVAFDSITWWEFGLALLATAGGIVALVRFAGRVYAGGLLKFGGRVKLSEAYRSADL